MFKQEWKNLWQAKKILLAVCVIAIIPIIYAGILLGSYWDPYGKTENIGVAVVNEDKAVKFEDETLDVGNELVKELKKNKDFKWDFVSEKEAEKGYDENKYFVILKIPKDFSKNASTVLDKETKKMDLEYRINPGRNFITKSIGESMANNLKEKVSKTVTEAYAKAIFAKIEEIGEGFSEAADGAKKIDDGTEEAKEGTNKLTENLKKLASSTITFEEGTKKLQEGAVELENGTVSLREGATKLSEGVNTYTTGVDALNEKTNLLTDQENGVPKLASSQNQLNEGLKTIQQGGVSLENGLTNLNQGLPTKEQINQLTTGMQTVQTSIENLNTSVEANEKLPEELKKQIKELTMAVNQIQPKAIETVQGYSTVSNALEQKIIPGVQGINGGLTNAVDGSNQLTNATSSLNEKMPLLVDGVNKLASNSESLRNGATALENGTEKIATNAPNLTNGLTELTNGSSQLTSATSQLSDGSQELGKGITTLKDGTDELATKIKDGSEKVNDIKTTDENYTMIASPVETKETKDNEVPNYGHGLAPNFVSLALYIGAMAFNLIFAISKPSMLITTTRAFYLSKISVSFLQAICSALILDFVLIKFIGLEVENVGIFVLVTILTSLTYMALINFLVIAFDNPGRFIAMVLLVLQLASSGGMFPSELQTNFFSVINPFMLMTYAVYGFREGMTGAIGNELFTMSIIVLLVCFVLANVFMFIAMHIKKIKQMKQVERTTL